MQKTFLKHTQFREELIKKFSEKKTDKLDNENDIFDYLRFLLYKTGKSYYIPEEIELSQISNALEDWFENEHNLNVEKSKIKQAHILSIKPKKGIAKFLGLSKHVTLVIDKNRTYFSYIYMSPQWFKNPKIDSKNEKLSFLNSLFTENIEKFIFSYLTEKNISENDYNFASVNNYLVEDFSLKNQQFFLAEREDNEVLLSWLNIASVKNLLKNKDIYKKLDWFYVLTNFDSILLGLDKNGDVIEAINLQNRELKIKKSFRNTIAVGDYEWTPALGNSSLYSEIVKIADLDSKSKIRKTAVLNVSNSKPGSENFKYAKFLLGLIDDITVPLTKFLLDFIEDKQKATVDYSENDNLVRILKNILANPKAEEQLAFWFDDWKPNIEQSVFIIKMLIEATENIQHLQKLLPLHRQIYELAAEKEKNQLNKVLLDIQFSRHLIALEKHKEAEKIVKNSLKKLPDQEIIDLLPSEKIDPTGDLSGQFLKVILLELLAKTQNKTDAQDLTRKVAQLQPLSINRIYKLAGIKDKFLKEKAQTILKILKENGLSPKEDYKKLKIKPFEKKDFEIIKHPTIRKKGVLSSFSKWISSHKKPDFSTVKKYAENFSPAKHKQIGDIIADSLHLFGFSSIEVFIAHGQHSIGIKAYEDDVSFLTIGSEHLNPDSPYFLTYNELRFAIAVELAYLYFKFARITASDIWRGAMDKGNFVLNTLIDIIPFVGSLSAVVKNATKIKAISNFFDKNEQITRLLSQAEKFVNTSTTNQSQSILSIASQMISSMSDSFSDNDKTKKEQLIAVSRMMQITADRIGLIFNNDPVSSVRAVFLTSKDITANLTTINKYGLNSFLLKKDNKGNFVNQNFAVRFASLFSFWLSEDFLKLRNKLIEEK